MHITVILLAIFASLPVALMQQTFENHQDEYDSPSPEWIKYQRERYDPKYNKVTSTVSATHNLECDENTQPKKKQTSRKNSERREQQMNEQEKVATDDASEQKQSKTDDSNELKYPSIQGFIAFINSLRHTWAKKSLFSIEDKIQFLYNLKDSLMRTIEKQFFTIWPDNDDDDHKYRSVRRKRGLLDESNIDFPPEAALMSINFLTFAVFLIKLVLQVVNIIKNKHVQYTAMDMGTETVTTG
ncbi:uncharacterized protein LOC106084035 [Stomoxys calcitrans]|uniref:uncharacterized protein LOC106084035 n=1 Tax=Stomoxys calcitrans TaxID=35570 RepID=UPI0027E24EFF|nr:uncharacterized protein LOC106084035 [Stomoxys calcitrans]